MERAEIIDPLTTLGGRLADQGLEGEMYVVGGAAIAIAFDERRTTRDIDAVFEPKQAIYDAAAAVARERNLPVGWLNDAVKGYLAGPDVDTRPSLEVPGLRVSTASPRILLAMKVLAHRATDTDDIKLLATELELSTATEILSLVADVYGDRLPPASRFLVEELFGS